MYTRSRRYISLFPGACVNLMMRKYIHAEISGFLSGYSAAFSNFWREARARAGGALLRNSVRGGDPKGYKGELFPAEFQKRFFFFFSFNIREIVWRGAVGTLKK